ncbi:DUF58 domain-containing protein [Microbacterium amylolyticum]|uniref:Uncharacterized protein (DUF58 family) n=1 Tax=Microbacterium amylolyticum TaxID=936337 RepID=A0ABS4ZN11_9MICO|nr:DUF58 domain-containing protein [Microbacterium amylolyticum]MBP2437836.1 uncharacterized protein (DUF58 family) [Microbacterium amylolyticum]
MTRRSSSRRDSLPGGVRIGMIAAVTIAAIGLIASRPDVVLLALPLALGTTFARGRAVATAPDIIVVPPKKPNAGRTTTEISVASDAESVHLAILVGQAREHDVVLAPGEVARATSRVQHSGPWVPVIAVARTVDIAGAGAGDPGEQVSVRHTVAPVARPLQEIPVPYRLSGLHGVHNGHRAGQGGDFRDTHPFHPGDELRRVDWKATARRARNLGDLHVRRVDAMSDASVAIVIDSSDDLGQVVGTWSSGDRSRSGVTSLDLGREAARSLAVAATGVGDRVALHELGRGGHNARSGAQSRHLARLVRVISDIEPRGPISPYARVPLIERGAVVFVLSTFIDPAAREVALQWAETGHRVIAVDVLPSLDTSRLDGAERASLRMVLAERAETLADLTRAGIDTVRWAEEPSVRLRILARQRRR